jgi:excisionase family DNA binding protein
MTIPEAARRIGLGRDRTRSLVIRGQLRSIRVGARQYVPVIAIHEFVRRPSLKGHDTAKAG